MIKKTQRLLLSTQKAELHSYLNHFFLSNTSPLTQKKMAEAFAAEIAKSLLGKLGSFAVQEFRLAWGLEDDLARLEERLKAINVVLSDAEKQQSKNDRIGSGSICSEKSCMMQRTCWTKSSAKLCKGGW
jgi:hypothetical protein